MIKLSGCNCSQSNQNCKNKLNQKTQIKNLLIGAPNVGKSTFFNRITWQHSPVGNIDKMTVYSNLGTFKGDKSIKFLDLPGVYSLTPNTTEENIVIDTILSNEYDKIINIISANCLKRDLLLTIDLLESNKLYNLIINMVDEFGENRIKQFKLVNKLGVCVDLISAAKNKNIKSCISNILNIRNKKNFKLDYGNEIEDLINQLTEVIDLESVNKRFIAIQILLNNTYLIEYLKKYDFYQQIIDVLNKNQIDLNITKQSIRQTRIKYIDELYDSAIVCDLVLEEKNLRKEKRDAKFDKLMFNRFFGIFMFIVIILAIYYITFGGYAGGWINEQWTWLLDLGKQKANEAILNSHIANNFWVANFVSEGLLGGIFTVIGFLPYIIIMYFFMTLLEQTGMLARISVLMDKSLSRFGLSGRSIITLITGVGCNIPAIMMARNSQSKKERIIVILIAPFIACSARLVVYQWIASAIVSIHFSWLISFALTLFSGLIALLIGYFFSNTLFRKQNSFFLTELPRWRKPNLVIILKGMGIELWGFLKRTATLILIFNLVIFFLMYISPVYGLISNIQQIEYSFLHYISIPFQYLFYPIGLGEDWRLAMSLISAAPAKELAASNLEIMFGGQEQFHQFLFSSNLFIAPVSSAISFLLFFSFYIPCMSAFAVLKKEAGWKWSLIHLLTATIISYVISLIAFSYFGVFEKIIRQQINISNYISVVSITLICISGLLIIGIIINKIVLVSKNINHKKYLKYNRIFWIFSICFIFVNLIINLVFIFIS